MKSTIFPFSQNRKHYPEGSLIIKEVFPQENKYSVIEYDAERILKTLNNEDPTEDFSEFPKITKEQLFSFLKLVTTNIVEVTLETK